MAWSVRPAAAEDADGIAAVHVETWRAAYAGIVPQTFLDALRVEKRAAMWRSFFAEGKVVPGQTIHVAEDAGRIVGFVNSGPDRGASAPGAGEIRAIYVLPTHWDLGVGRALHDRSIEALRAARFPNAVLWVFEDNARARRFYERCGWRPDGGRLVNEAFGGPLAELRYAIDLSETAAPRGG